MKVLVLGAYGMLGHRLFLELGRQEQVTGTCRRLMEDGPVSDLMPTDRLIPGVDAEDFDTVKKAISIVDPDAIVNCIGIVKQVKEAQDPIKSIRTNSLFPHLLARECVERGLRLIHFSTDCVFSGMKGKYTLGDIPDATDLYGRTKLIGEVVDAGCITIRSSLIGRELGSANGLIEWLVRNKGGKVRGYKQAMFSGFTITEMSRIAHMILTEHPRMSGTWHVASKPISKYDLLVQVNDKMGLGIEIDEDTILKIDRSLDGSAFQKETGYIAPSWEAMIEEMAREATQYGSISSGRR